MVKSLGLKVGGPQEIGKRVWQIHGSRETRALWEEQAVMQCKLACGKT
jgi:hypothetical protein